MFYLGVIKSKTKTSHICFACVRYFCWLARVLTKIFFLYSHTRLRRAARPPVAQSEEKPINTAINLISNKHTFYGAKYTSVSNLIRVCVCGGERCEKLCGCGGGGEAAVVMVWGIKTRHSHVRAQKFLLSPWIA